jgi:hypothetical protein
MLPWPKTKTPLKPLSGDGSRQCMFNLFVAQSLDGFNRFSDKKVTVEPFLGKFLDAKSLSMGRSF